MLTEDRNRPFDQQVLDLMRSAAKEQGRTPRDVRGQPAVEEALVRSRLLKNNRPDGMGVGVVNGDSNLAQYIQERTLPLVELTAVVLGTGGLLPQGWRLDDECDRRRLYEVLSTGGLTQVISLKRRSEDADPDWWYLRFKHSDDATGVFVRLEEDHAYS